MARGVDREGCLHGSPLADIDMPAPLPSIIASPGGPGDRGLRDGPIVLWKVLSRPTGPASDMATLPNLAISILRLTYHRRRPRAPTTLPTTPSTPAGRSSMRPVLGSPRIL